MSSNIQGGELLNLRENDVVEFYLFKTFFLIVPTMYWPSFAEDYLCAAIVFIDKRTNLTMLADVQRNKYKEVHVYIP